MKLALDTSVFIYATGREHPHRDPCRRLLERLQGQSVEPDVSIELLQEYVHVRTRGGVPREQSVAETQRIVAICRVHDVTMGRMQLALRLFGQYPRLDMKDALHAATALSCFVDAIVTPDTDFDEIDGLPRLDPSRALKAIDS